MDKILKILMFLGTIAEDIFILLGLILIISATFMISLIAGIYILGFIWLVIGLIMARKPPRKE